MKKTKSKWFSFRKKMYLFVAVTVLVAALGTAFISYFINADKIDRHFKDLSYSCAENFAALVDADYYAKLREVAESEEYQQIRQQAEEAEDESLIEDYLNQKGLWEKYVESREFLIKYLRNMDSIKYLYALVWSSPESDKDMYLLDDDDNPIYVTGSYTPREPEFAGVDASKKLEPTISDGDWGWLCSAYVPVYDSDGSIICHIGCDVNMEDVMSERNHFLAYLIIGSLAFTQIVLMCAMLFVTKTVVKPLNALTREMKNFKPSDNASYEEAGVVDLNIKSRDEIYDIYHGIRDMQMNIVNYLNDMSLMQKEKERRDTELSIATNIQADMMPRNYPDSREFSLYADMKTAKLVGGDFYDFFMTDDDHLALVMADVSGNGVPAALFMIIAKTIIKNRTLAGGDPAKILEDVNIRLCDNNESDLFVTAWLGIFEISSGTLTFCNAGHEYPSLRRRNGDYELLITDNLPPLAAMDDTSYENTIIRLKKGDSLFLYTDGVPEAKNRLGARFGMNKMAQILNKNKDMPLEKQINELKKEIDSFTGDCDLFDDITMLIFKLNE